QTADIVAPQCLCAADRGRVKQIRRTGRVDVFRRNPGQYRREPHLLDEVMRCYVRAEADIDAAAPVAPEILERLPIPGEWRRAMCNRRPAAGKNAEVFARVPMQQ